MVNLLMRISHWIKNLFDAPQKGAYRADESNTTAQIEHEITQNLVPYDENLLEQSRIQWQHGDWASLVTLDHEKLRCHPERAKLALLATAGHLQLGNSQDARRLSRIAREWGCTNNLIGKVLISGVHNTLGRAEIVAGHQSKALHHFETAIQIAGFCGDPYIFVQSRRKHQNKNIGINFKTSDIATDPYIAEDLASELKNNQDSLTDFIDNTKINSNQPPAGLQSEVGLSILFEDIYKQKSWGFEEGWKYFSGSGSHDATTVKQYVNSIINFFGNSTHLMSALDIGCGDFNVGRLICGSFKEYIAVDIVPSLINHNRDIYSDTNVQFLCLDVTKDIIPSCDVAIIRQVLQHLSNDDITRVLRNAKGKFNYLVIVEHVPSGTNWTPNLDRPASSSIRLEINSGIEIEAPPFNFSYQNKHIVAEREEYGGLIRTTIYVLQ